MPRPCLCLLLPASFPSIPRVVPASSGVISGLCKCPPVRSSRLARMLDLCKLPIPNAREPLNAMAISELHAELAFRRYPGRAERVRWGRNHDKVPPPGISRFHHVIRGDSTYPPGPADLAGRCSRRRRRSAERRSIQATIWPATAAPSTLAPSTTSTASSSCAAIATTGSLPAGALERGSSPTTKSARSSAGSSEAGLSGGSRCQIELGWGAPACASRASGLAGPDGVRAGACAPAHFARM